MALNLHKVASGNNRIEKFYWKYFRVIWVKTKFGVWKILLI